VRLARLPLQSHTARKTRSVLPGELYSEGKSSTKFVRKQDLPAIRKQLKNYERMKLLFDQWIDLATELSNLQIKQNRT
jgi:hypothetical protein